MASQMMGPVLRLFLAVVGAQRRQEIGSFLSLGRIVDEYEGVPRYVVCLSCLDEPQLVSYLLSGYISLLAEKDDRFVDLRFEKGVEKIAIPKGCVVYVFNYRGNHLGVVDCGENGEQ